MEKTSDKNREAEKRNINAPRVEPSGEGSKSRTTNAAQRQQTPAKTNAPAQTPPAEGHFASVMSSSGARRLAA
jgi:hypothetical protein